MAGSWGAVQSLGNDAVNGNQQNMFALSAEFTADASAATVPDLTLTNYQPAFLTDVGVKFDGTTAPNAVTVTVKDRYGLTTHPNDTISFSASGRYVVSDRPSCVGGVTVSISGNSTNSAKAIVTLYFVANNR